MTDQLPPETPSPGQPGKPTETPQETPPVGPDTDRPDPQTQPESPVAPTEVPPETSPPSPDFDQPAPGADPNPTPVSPIGEGTIAPPD